MGPSDPPRSRFETTQTAFFVIADISGYTGFLAHNELAHAQGILAEITQLLIDRLSAPFRFVELEGDAVFVFAPSVAVEDSERLIDIMEACYAAFRMRLEQMVVNTTCECSACRMIPGLDLKLVAHFGRYIPQKTPTGTKLVGPDVILVHRLLKNAVIEKTGIKSYALLTNAFISKAAFARGALGLPHHVEEIPELGVIEGRVLDLAASIDRYRTAARRYIGPGEAGLEIATELPAARSLAWAYFVDAKRRLQWQRDTKSIENNPSASGRSGVGWESHCDHGGYSLDHRITDWHPFDYLSMETTAMGRSMRKPPDCDITFDFQELEHDRCRLVMRVRAKNPGVWMRLMLWLARPIVKREWQNHFVALNRLLGEDVARADAATTAPASVA
jgi:uncharacterized protein YndB with AHSA1/START domain